MTANRKPPPRIETLDGLLSSRQEQRGMNKQTTVELLEHAQEAKKNIEHQRAQHNFSVAPMVPNRQNQVVWAG